MKNLVEVNYQQTGESTSVNNMGMRAMQARAFESRNSQYLLLKAPPASGKSRALMFLGLDKIHNQGLSKVIVAVPERSIGGSFASTKLSESGFFADWDIKPENNLCTAGGDKSKVKAFKHFMEGTDQILVCTHATLRFAFEELEDQSSIVRALLTEYKDQGLRLIEIERDDLSDLPEIQKLIQKRPEKFIVYCDDLAFNAEDENYRSLKSVLDGSLQSGTSNFIIYATSNRRHLLPEFMHENTPVTRVDVPQYTELHPQEAIEEKISLSDRFGMWLSFYPMDQNLYLTIVEHYLAKTDMPMNDEAHAEALRWCQARGQRSGRAAYQFSKHWIGSQQLKAL